MGVRVPTPHWASSDLSLGRGHLGARRAAAGSPRLPLAGLWGLWAWPAFSVLRWRQRSLHTRVLSCWVAPTVSCGWKSWLSRRRSFVCAHWHLGFLWSQTDKANRKLGEARALRSRARGMAVSTHRQCPVSPYILVRDWACLDGGTGTARLASPRAAVANRGPRTPGGL